MSIVSLNTPNAAIGVAVAETPKDMSTIHKDGCAAVIWRRRALPEFQSWIDACPPNCLPSGRVTLQANDLRDALDHFCQAAHLPRDEHADRLKAALSVMAELFTKMTKAPLKRMSLEANNTNQCKKR